MTWQPSTYEEGLRMAWDEDDDGVEHCLRHIRPHIPDGFGRVVDIGCGVGRLTIPLGAARPSAEIIGFDTSDEMLDLARERNHRSNVQFWSRMPSHFDFAFSVVTFQHISDTDMRAYLRACARAEAPIVFQFVEGTEREPLSMQRLTSDVISWVRAAGFTQPKVWPDERFPNWRWVHAR